MKESIQDVVEKLLDPYLQQHNMMLVDVEYVKQGRSWFLRVYIDKEGGVDLDDCGEVSNYLSEQLDKQDPIPGTYFLEVSSPGAERPLKKPKDFYWAIGKHVLIRTYEPVDGMREFEGTLQDYDEETLTVQVGTVKHEIPANKIAKARLAVIL